VSAGVRAGALVLAAFFAGGFPTARLVGRLWGGLDIGRVGTGNAGAANVRRTLGAKAGAVVLAGDAGKAALPGLVARRLGLSDYQRGAVMFAPVAGHVFLAGGKGAAAALGGALVNDPVAVLGITPLLAGGIALDRHAPSVAITYAALPLVYRLLRRPSGGVGWATAMVVLLTARRLLGSGGWSLPVSREAAWERFWFDRDPPQALPRR